MHSNDDLKTLRFSTAQLAGQDASDIFRETFGRTILRVDIESVEGHVLEAEMTLRAFSNCGMATGLLSPMRVVHRPDLIDNDDLVVVFIEKGPAVLQQHGRTVEMADGGVVLTDNGVSGTFTGYARVHALNVRLSRTALAPFVADLGAALLNPLIANNPAVRLLKSYASSLNDEVSLATPHLRHVAATHMHDLAALAIGAVGDAKQIAVSRGVRAARLAAIKADIAANLANGGLSTEMIAARHGISARYVRVLFESEGTSFSEFLLEHRLLRAFRMLGDPRYVSRTISAVAFDCGFGDLSYFNRCFRRRFGATPSDIREQART